MSNNFYVWSSAIFLVLFAISEFLSLFPKVKSNGIFQFIKNALIWIKNNLLKK